MLTLQISVYKSPYDTDLLQESSFFLRIKAIVPNFELASVYYNPLSKTCLG